MSIGACQNKVTADQSHMTYSLVHNLVGIWLLKNLQVDHNPEDGVGGGGGGTYQSLIRGSSALRFNPLPFYIPFCQ